MPLTEFEKLENDVRDLKAMMIYVRLSLLGTILLVGMVAFMLFSRIADLWVVVNQLTRSR